MSKKNRDFPNSTVWLYIHWSADQEIEGSNPIQGKKKISPAGSFSAVFWRKWTQKIKHWLERPLSDFSLKGGVEWCLKKLSSPGDWTNAYIVLKPTVVFSKSGLMPILFSAKWINAYSQVDQCLQPSGLMPTVRLGCYWFGKIVLG